MRQGGEGDGGKCELHRQTILISAFVGFAYRCDPWVHQQTEVDHDRIAKNILSLGALLGPFPLAVYDHGELCARLNCQQKRNRRDQVNYQLDCERYGQGARRKRHEKSNVKVDERH